MLKSLFGGLALASLAAPALSLSCMPPHMGDSYNLAAASEKVYVLAEGRFSADAPLPEVIVPDQNAQGDDGSPGQSGAQAVLRFSGRHLGVSADGDLQAPVSVSVDCVVIWCGAFPPLDTRVLTFLERDPENGALSMEMGPCPGQYFERPTDRQINVLRACMQNGTCGPREMDELGLNRSR